MKTWQVAVVVASLAAGFIAGFFVGKPTGGNSVTTNYGVKIKYITNYSQFTNSEDNMNLVYDDYFHYSTDPFIFKKQNEYITVSLWKRTAKEKIIIKNSGPVLGGGIDYIPNLPFPINPVVTAGWRFDNLLILGEIGFGVQSKLGIRGLWQFDWF